MAGDQAKQIHIETVVGLFGILDTEVIDVDTIVATYQVPSGLATETLEKGQRLGVFGEVSRGGYKLTKRGERKLEDLQFRSSAVEVISD